MKTFQLATILRILEAAKNIDVTQLEIVDNLIFSFDPQQSRIRTPRETANRYISGARPLPKETRKVLRETSFEILKQRIEENIFPLLKESQFNKIKGAIKSVLNYDESIDLNEHIGPNDASFTKNSILTTDSLSFSELIAGVLYYVSTNTTAIIREKDTLLQLRQYIEDILVQNGLKENQQEEIGILSRYIDQATQNSKPENISSLKSNKEVEQLLIDADNGVPPAQCYLGYLLMRGLAPFKQNYERAAYYLQQAALQGDIEAIYLLSGFFKNGWATEKNEETALGYLTIAANHDHPSALFELANYYINGIIVEQDLSKAFELLERAAKQNNADALIALGIAYECGIDGVVNSNVGVAYRHFSKAKELGHPAAEEYLDRIL